MITHKRRGVYHVLNLFRLKGSTFPFAICVALPPAALAGVLHWTSALSLDNVALDYTSWVGFTVLVGMLVLFRVWQAVDRLWSGARALYIMRAEWLEAVFALCAYTKHSTREPEAVGIFKHLIVRLFSVLHAMALGEIEDCDAARLKFDLEIIDGRGLNAQSWAALRRSTRKAELVSQWIQALCVENIETQVLSVPAALLSKALQHLSEGMVKLHEAKTIAEIPIPFAFTQTADCLLLIHWIVAPLVTVYFTASIEWSVAFTFIQVFTLWAFNCLADQLESPFGHDDNDLDMVRLQCELNKTLLMLLDPDTQETPRLSKEACLGDDIMRGKSNPLQQSNFKTLSKLGLDAARGDADEECWEIGYPVSELEVSKAAREASSAEIVQLPIQELFERLQWQPPQPQLPQQPMEVQEQRQVQETPQQQEKVEEQQKPWQPDKKPLALEQFEHQTIHDSQQQEQGQQKQEPRQQQTQEQREELQQQLRQQEEQPAQKYQQQQQDHHDEQQHHQQQQKPQRPVLPASSRVQLPPLPVLPPRIQTKAPPPPPTRSVPSKAQHEVLGRREGLLSGEFVAPWPPDVDIVEGPDCQLLFPERRPFLPVSSAQRCGGLSPPATHEEVEHGSFQISEECNTEDNPSPPLTPTQMPPSHTAQLPQLQPPQLPQLQPPQLQPPQHLDFG